ncbi:hypothetical protein, partial [Nocardioides sp. REDSEA-S30_B4]|uniref:hypothetical protein n=1 Tax=Nocardioides sp. REDSEA-S30_B4 TaxID=1811552 RepID=UPI0025CC2DBA
MRAQQVGHVADEVPGPVAGGVVATGHGQLEIQLAQAVAQRDLRQRPVAGQRPERRVVQRHQGRGEHIGIDVDRPPAQLLADPRPQLGLEDGGVGVGVLQDRVDQRPERGACRQLGHRRDRGRMRRLGVRLSSGGRHAGQVGQGLVGLVGQHRHRRLAADRGRLLLHADQPRVGGTTPGGVDLASEGPHPQLGLLAAARRGALLGRLDHLRGRP